MDASASTPPPALGSAANPVLAAGVVLWRHGAAGVEFLLLKNARHGSWGFAKGHLEEGEDLYAGALREVAEETGLRLGIEDLLAGFADTSIYRPEAGTERYKRVVYLLAGSPLKTDLQFSDEHTDYAWLDASAAMERLEHEDLKRTVARASLRLSDLLEE